MNQKLVVQKIVRRDFAYCEPRVESVHLYTDPENDEEGHATKPMRHFATLHNLTTEEAEKLGDTLTLNLAKPEPVLANAEVVVDLESGSDLSVPIK